MIVSGPMQSREQAAQRAQGEPYLAFRGKVDSGQCGGPPLPGEIALHLWRPAWRRLLPPFRLHNLGGEKMFTLATLAFFALYVLVCGPSNAGTVAIATDETRATVGFAVLRGPDPRFPFMGRRDAQIGPVWTAPGYRRQGVAKALCRAVLRQPGVVTGEVWWLCRSDNDASRGLAQVLGLALAGAAERRPLPFFPLSHRYTLHHAVHRTQETR